MVEGCGDELTRGKHTDLFMAVNAEGGENVVFRRIVWPDKATRDAAGVKMMSDPRSSELGDKPFDGKRMIFSGLAPILQA